jgi:hypothetical protein
LKDFLFVAEFASGGSAVEPPVDLDLVAIHAAIPCPALPAQRLEIRNSPGARALPREDVDFDLGLIEPASVLECSGLSTELLGSGSPHLPLPTRHGGTSFG